jgi:hypothetical protein
LFNAILIAAITIRLYRDEKENKDLIWFDLIWFSRLRAGCQLGLLFIGSAPLYKDAEGCQRTSEGDRHILSKQKGEE